MCYNSMRHQLFLGLGIETGDIIQNSMIKYGIVEGLGPLVLYVSNHQKKLRSVRGTSELLYTCYNMLDL